MGETDTGGASADIDAPAPALTGMRAVIERSGPQVSGRLSSITPAKGDCLVIASPGADAVGRKVSACSFWRAAAGDHAGPQSALSSCRARFVRPPRRHRIARLGLRLTSFHVAAAALGLTAIFLDGAGALRRHALPWRRVISLWLAWDALRPGGRELFADAQSACGCHPTVVPAWALLTSVLNPKVAMFYLALFPSVHRRDARQRCFRD